jgi:microcystin-dependent protein
MPQTPFVGQIMPAGFGFAPKGWALCNGALLAIPQNQALFSLLGTTYGGDGIRTFALPDLRGRAVLGSNLANVPSGQISGTENVTLTTDQLPMHNHGIQASKTAGTKRVEIPSGKLFGVNTAAPVDAIFASMAGTQTALALATNIAPIGGTSSHNNMQPFLVINYVIALIGVFPTRS